MITSIPLRNVSRGQAMHEIALCLEDDPEMAIAELAERLVISFDLIEDIVSDLK